MRPRFRIVPESDAQNRISAPESKASPEMISVPLGEILEPLTEAIRTDRTFLRDFTEDEIRVSADLFDALTTYQRLRIGA